MWKKIVYRWKCYCLDVCHIHLEPKIWLNDSFQCKTCAHLRWNADDRKRLAFSEAQEQFKKDQQNKEK